MKLNDDNIKKIYENINELICLNFIIFIKEDNKFSKLDYYKIADEIKSLEYETCELINNEIEQSKSKGTFLYKNKLNLKYMGFPILDENKYIGSLILGPYIEEDTYKSLQGSSYYRSFYNDIQTINCAKEKSIAFLINNIINSPLDKVIFTEINKNINSNQVKRILDNYDANIVSVRRKYLVEKELLYYINQGNKVKAIELIYDKSIYGLSKLYEHELETSKRYTKELNALIRKEVIENGVDSYIAHNFSQKFISEIDRSKDTKYLYKVINQMINEYCDLINNHNTKGYSQVVIKAIEYINLNFTEDISLSCIASELYIHPSHLARKFKSERNETISKYLNKVRIREAKFLLKNRNFSIEEVAYKVGYNNTKYFAKIFKEIENNTPSKYKMQK